MESEKPFDAVRLMRQLRARVTRKLDGLTYKEQHRWIHEQIALRNRRNAQLRSREKVE